MDLGIAWTLGIGVIGIVVSMLLYRLANPKRRLEWWIESTPLVGAIGTEQIENLSIKVENVEIADPFLNTITLVANSRADIPSSAFDSGRPMVISITKGGALGLQREEPNGAIRFEAGRGEGFEWAKHDVNPQLIRKKAKGKLVFVSSGKPEVQIESSLIDIEVRRIASDKVDLTLTMSRRLKWAISAYTIWCMFLFAFLVYGMLTKQFC